MPPSPVIVDDYSKGLWNMDAISAKRRTIERYFRSRESLNPAIPSAN
jgi:hypothetical protein